ncbi:MAG: imidazole glycerol phosphate synthase subunit HisH [Bacteroidota bacterium]
MKLAIIDYNAGNTQSVIFALNRLGIEPVLTADHAELQSADKVILPGVGHARSAMDALIYKGLDKLIPELKQPVLGICLGQQLMCRFSEEGNTDCLGIFDLPVKLFAPTEKVPHMGWNQVDQLKGKLFEGIDSGEYFYHVHSYYVPLSEFATAQCDYILPFSTALNRDNFYATQFHPEKSGKAGESVLRNFIGL